MGLNVFWWKCARSLRCRQRHEEVFLLDALLEARDVSVSGNRKAGLERCEVRGSSRNGDCRVETVIGLIRRRRRLSFGILPLLPHRLCRQTLSPFLPQLAIPTLAHPLLQSGLLQLGFRIPMGSHVSCISPAASSNSASSEPAINFLNCKTGAISQLEGPLTAAEAMMEFPAQFLCCFSSAAACADRGRRICAVPADEELQSAELYLLLPMHRLNTRFSLEEVAAFATLDEAARKCLGKQAKYCKGAAISQSKVAPFPAPAAAAAAAASEALHRSIAESAGLAMLRGGSFKRLEGRSGVQDDVRGAVRGLHMCMSKSWMPKLQTVNEYAVFS
ncbi:hypothetical protein L7F22_012171 [Adiantum nelumboides]|nr:hypothetical protein [Adiantum nelumboides]